ncbi:MAG: LexA repressor [Eubacterium sp.]|nr:LexA repressor [Eubacterium sp.]
MENQIRQDGDSKELVYDFLVNYITENLYAPTIREICEGTYLSSTSSVAHHLSVLEEEGKIEIKGNSSRAIKLVGYKFVKTED